MKTLTMRRLWWGGAALMMALAGCGTRDEAGNNESPPNPGEEKGGTVSAATSVTKTLYYQGPCWWLNCHASGSLGACGYGCSDTRLGLVRDYSWRLGCGQTVRVAANGRSAYATVWDSSCCGRFEGTDALMSALAIAHSVTSCSAQPQGEALATIVY